MRMIAIIAISPDSAATEVAAVYAEHNMSHSPVDLQPFKGRVYVSDIPKVQHALHSPKHCPNFNPLEVGRSCGEIGPNNLPAASSAAIRSSITVYS